MACLRLRQHKNPRCGKRARFEPSAQAELCWAQKTSQEELQLDAADLAGNRMLTDAQQRPARCQPVSKYPGSVFLSRAPLAVRTDHSCRCPSLRAANLHDAEGKRDDPAALRGSGPWRTPLFCSVSASAPSWAPAARRCSRRCSLAALRRTNQQDKRGNTETDQGCFPGASPKARKRKDPWHYENLVVWQGLALIDRGTGILIRPLLSFCGRNGPRQALHFLTGKTDSKSAL